MDRRKFLTGASAAGASLFAGCGGGGGDGGVPGQQTTRTSTQTTTTTTVSSENLEGQPTNMGSYTDWMVGKEDATLFLMSYYPRYSWLVESLPENYMKASLNRELTNAGSPTTLVSPSSVERYFYGFTDVSQLTYNLLWGSFDAEAARERATTDTQDDGLGFEALNQSVGEFDLFQKSQRVFGITSEMLIDVQVGFADPIANFETVHTAVTGGGDVSTFPSMNDDYSMLTEELDGHNVQILPNEGSNNWEIGTTAFAREFTYANEDASLTREVMVYGEEPTEDQVRSDAEQNSGVISSLSASISEVTVDGRLAIVDYGGVRNSAIYRGSGYTQN